MVVRAHEIMTRAVVSVTPDAPVEHARQLLAENRYSALPVVDDRHCLVGIVTTWDLLRAASSGAGAATVGALMTRDPVWMHADADVRVVAHRLRHHGALRAMPIAEHGVLVGIVTRGDLLRAHGGTGGERWPGPARPDDTGAPCPPVTAADVMVPRADTVVVGEATPVRDAAALLLEHRLTALPVVDDDGHVVGVVSEVDLVPDTLSGRRVPRPRTAGDAMTRDALGVRDDVGLHAVARVMVEQRLRVLPVVDRDDRLVGIVDRGALLGALAVPAP